MAQELQLIVDLLKEMRNANDKTTEAFDRLLNSIAKNWIPLKETPHLTS